MSSKSKKDKEKEKKEKDKKKKDKKKAEEEEKDKCDKRGARNYSQYYDAPDGCHVQKKVIKPPILTVLVNTLFSLHYIYDHQNKSKLRTQQ